ncbi:lactonase family protein [Isoptericola hypogeus]|uniref:Lactonase family protein n=1 Tax=Isoptericola hypogeus TaxID=300179 RepID=A0ABN2JLA4_9MICO
MTDATTLPLWIGTYPAPGAAPGSGEGIWYVAVDTADGSVRSERLATTLPSASFLALHPSGRTLYAVSETSAGTLTAFRLEEPGPDGMPVPAVSGSVPTGGDDPCHVLAREGDAWVANYGDGVASSVAVDPATGDLAAGSVATHPGAGDGPVADRQAGPHAHFVADAGDHVLVADLGADVLRRYPAAGAAAGAEGEIAAVLPPGTGPRHLVELPDGSLVVVGELDARVHVLSREGDGWAPASSTPVCAGADAGSDFAAHVTLSADGSRVHVGVRGSDVLAVHRVRYLDDGAPTLEHLADVPLGDGAWPRHHAVVRVGHGADETGAGTELVVVALQGRSELAGVRIDLATGAGEVVSRHRLPTPPACVLEA